MCKLPALASGSKSASPAGRATTQGQCPHFCWGLADVRCNWFACDNLCPNLFELLAGRSQADLRGQCMSWGNPCNFVIVDKLCSSSSSSFVMLPYVLSLSLATCAENGCRLPHWRLYWKHLLFLENFWCETSEKTQEGWNLRSRNSVPLCFPLLYVYAAKWRLWGCHHVKCWRALARDAAGCETSSKQSTRLSFLEFHILYLIR